MATTAVDATGVDAEDPQLEIVIGDEAQAQAVGVEEEEEGSEPDDSQQTDEELERLRKRNKLANRDKKHLRNQRDELKAELEEMRRQVAELRQGHQSVQKREAERELAGIDAEITWAEEQRKKAFSAGDPDEFDAADKQLRAAFARKQMAETRPVQQHQPNRLAEQWKRENDWFERDPEGIDASIANAISASLIRRGIAGNDPRHFEELNKELKVRAPHLFEEEAPQPKPKNRSVGGGALAQSSGPAKRVSIPESVIADWMKGGIDFRAMKPEEQKAMALDYMKHNGGR